MLGWLERATRTQTRPLMQTATSAFPETFPGLLLPLGPEIRWEEISLYGRQGPGRKGTQSRFSSSSQTYSVILINTSATCCSHLLRGAYSLAKQSLQKLFKRDPVEAATIRKGLRASTVVYLVNYSECSS